MKQKYLSNIWSSVKLSLHTKHKRYVQYLQLNVVSNNSRNIFLKLTLNAVKCCCLYKLQCK